MSDATDHPTDPAVRLRGLKVPATAKPAKAKAKPAKAKPAKAKAKPAKAQPGHYTASGNKKHQCNGPIAWSKVLLAAAHKELGATAREGDGVRLALAIGVEALAKRHGLKMETSK